MAGLFPSKERSTIQPSPSSSSHPETVIGSTVRIEGTFNSDGSILIEGEVSGTLSTTQDVTVGKDANVKADITAQNMRIAGEVHGNLHAKGTVELQSSARVYGDIETERIAVESGAMMKGQCITQESTSPASPVSEKEQQQAGTE